jgi:hypothetical protein
MSIEISDTGYLNPAAFCTITGAAAGTVYSTFAVLSAGTTQKTAAYGLLAFGCMTGTFSAVTAWFDPSSKDAKSYLKNVSRHFCYGVPAMATTIANVLFNAAVEGISRVISDVVEAKLKKALS